MGIPLVIKNGDVAGSYTNHILSSVLGLRKWKRDFKAAFIAYSGTPYFNGKPHFGGRCNVSNFATDAANELGDVCGLDDDAKAEISAVYAQGDISTYINLVAKRIYTLDALHAHMRDEFAPQIALGSSVTISRSYEIEVPTGDPTPTPPAQTIKIGAAQSVDDSILYGGLLTEEINRTVGHLYHSTPLFNNHADAITLSNSTPVLTRENYLLKDTYTYTATVTIDLGASDISYLSDKSILDADVYSNIYLGTDDNTYFINSSSARYRSVNVYDYNTIAGVIWNYVNDWISGNTGSFYNVQPSIEGTYYRADGEWSSLYIDEAYWDSLSLLETIILVQQTVNVGVEQHEGGFFSTFLGGFVGAFLGLVSNILDFIDGLPVVNPIILSIDWAMDLAGVDENFIEDFDTVYRKIRTAIILYGATMGFGAASQSVQVGGTAADGFLAGLDYAAFNIGTMSIAEISKEFGSYAIDAAMEIALSQDAGSFDNEEKEEEEEEIYGISFKDNIIDTLDGDYVDTAYWYMDQPLNATP